MDQPVPPATPPAVPATGAPRGPIDPAQIKSMLNLPETASDLELVTALVELISNLQQKYDALLSDTVAMEDKVANRDLEDFKDVIPTGSEDFWRGQLLANREQTVTVLTSLRAAAKPAAAAPAAPAATPRVPLRNRLVDQPRALGELTGGPIPDVARAVAIRNRAHDLRKAERLPWSEAFARAEKEMNK